MGTRALSVINNAIEITDELEPLGDDTMFTREQMKRVLRYCQWQIAAKESWL